MSYNYLKITSPVGPLHLVADAKQLLALIFDRNWKAFKKELGTDLIAESNQVLKLAEKQLQQYFKGQRKDFSIPVLLAGTPFQNKAWKSLMKIPYGQTISYGEQAKCINNPKAVRAIGGANGKNKICIIIPCHRVIGQDGSLTGFGAGIDIKKKLLQLEKDN